jgi:hypothetical protein
MAISKKEIDGVLEIIKKEYMLNNKIVPKDDIYFVAGSELKLSKNEVDWIIGVLLKNGDIVEKLKDNFHPFLNTEDLEAVKQIRERLNLENIQKCIDIFYEQNKIREEYDRYPDLLQLEEIFVEKFGKIEIERFKDFVREQVKKGELVRTPTLTYMKTPKIREFLEKESD